MGRGRAKAKQTKVARQLKYGGPETDFDRLQAELAGDSGDESADDAGDDESFDDEDPYAQYAEGDGDDERRHA